MENIGIIIQARNGSTRLPRKMSIPFYGDKSIIELLLERIKKELNVSVILATTNTSKDDELVLIARKLNCEVYRGSEENVLDRFVKAAESFNIERVIRLCADNPFIDISALQNLISNFRKTSADYYSYATSDNIPVIKTHYGFWAEGITLRALKKIQDLTTIKIYLEHVTNYIYTHNTLFKIEYLPIDKIVEKNSIRLTIDTKEDFELSKEIYSKVIQYKINFKSVDIVKFVNKNKNWLQVMDKQIKLNTK